MNFSRSKALNFCRSFTKWAQSILRFSVDVIETIWLQIVPDPRPYSSYEDGTMYEWFSSGTHKTRFSLCINWIYVPFDHPFVNSQHVEWCPIAIAKFFCTSCVCVCRSFCEGLMFTVVNLLTTHIINVLWFLLFSSCRSSIKAGKFEHLRLCPKYGAVFV